MPVVPRPRFQRIALILAAVALGAAGWPAQDVRMQKKPDQTENSVRLMVQLGHSNLLNSAEWSPDGKSVVTAGWDQSARVWDVATGKELVRLVGHSSKVNAAVWSPDGTRILTASDDQTADIWEAFTGKRILSLEGHTDIINTVRWSPDGKTVATGSNDASARIWDADTGKERFKLTGHNHHVDVVAWSPDGKRLATGGQDGSARVWDAATGNQLVVFKGHAYFNVESVDWSPDGVRIVTAGLEKIARVWDSATGKEIFQLTGHAKPVGAARFSPDGKKIVTVNSRFIFDSDCVDCSARIWDAATGQQLFRLESRPSPPTFAAWSPDGTRVVTVAGGFDSTDQTARIWDATTGKPLFKLEGHDKAIVSANWSPDGSRIVTASYDQTGRIWRGATGREQIRLTGAVNSVVRAAWSPSGNEILTSGYGPGVVHVWDVLTGRQRTRLQGHAQFVTSARWSPDGARIATSSWDNTARVWESGTGTELTRLAGHSDSVDVIAWSPDATRVATASWDKTARVWDPKTGKEVARFTGHTDRVSSLLWFPDGMRLVTKAGAGPPIVWDAATGKERFRLDSTNGFTDLAISPDGTRILTGNFDGRVRIWDGMTGQELLKTDLACFDFYGTQVGSAVWSPDGKRFATTCRDRGTRIWDAQTGKEVVALAEQVGPVYSVTWSPDGTRLVTNAPEGPKLWEAATGRPIGRLIGHFEGVGSVAFNKNGNLIVTGSSDGTARLWNAATGKELCSLVSFSDGGWATVDPDGRFDVSDPDEAKGLYWVVTENGRAAPYGIELFFRQYYEPGLLRRIVAGETFGPIPSIASLDRSQPVVTIGEGDVVPVLENGNQTGMADVTVTVTPPAGSSDRKSGKAYDLKLFRDGQLVGFSPGEHPFTGSEGFKTTFRVRLPRRNDPKTVEFSAYCFNGDSVRSTKAVRTVPVPELKTVKGKAYVVTFGVNRYQNPRIHPLRYAVADALALQKTLGDRFAGSEAFSEVVRVSLTSETGRTPTATRENLKAVFMRLAGRPVPETGIPGFEKLAAATPEDLIVLMFAGHGSCGEGGEFFVVPFDTGGAGDPLKRSISSAELTEWLRDVDAGEMAMILDTCQSGGAVGENFKPGPMDSRGLGQLSYDKGMRILAATQADNVALESGVLKQGFLSFSLAIEGLEEGKADFAPIDGVITLDEWLAFGARRVPELPAAIAAGTIRARILTQDAIVPSKPQVPVVFDFARRRARVVLQKMEKK